MTRRTTWMRLNALAEGKETRYFWSGTRLSLDGGSFGGEGGTKGTSTTA